MKCHDFKTWLSNLDTRKETVEAEARAHIEACEHCRTLYVLDAHLDTQIEESLRPVEIPDRLAARIEMDLQSSEKDTMFTIFPWKKLMPAFAIAALLFIFLNPFGGRLQGIDQIGSLAVKNHLNSELTMEFRKKDVEDVTRWFEGRLGFRVHMPDVEKHGLHFLGGRKCSLGKNDVAYLFYENAGEKVSLFAIDPSDISFNMEKKRTYSLSIKGCNVQIWNAGDQVYAMVE